MNILVLGGTRFFGRELVIKLIEAGNHLTVATRGIQPIPYLDSVTTIKIERSSLENIKNNKKQTWDIVYDQICYCSKDAQVATEAFNGRIGKLIMTSTEAVYPDGYNLRETAFNPREHSLKIGTRSDFSYTEGKRNAEAYYFQNADFPVVAVRIPFVFGINDYTCRLKNLIAAIDKEEKLKRLNLNAHISMIESSDIGSILAKIAMLDIAGEINAAPLTPIKIGRLLDLIVKTTGKETRFATGNERYFDSDFLLGNDRCINSELLRSHGIEAMPIENWLGGLIGKIHTKE